MGWRSFGHSWSTHDVMWRSTSSSKNGLRVTRDSRTSELRYVIMVNLTSWSPYTGTTVKCRYNAVFGVQEIDPYWPNGGILRASEMNNQCVWSKINHESIVLTWPAGGIRLFYSICMGTKGCHCRCGRLDDDFTPFAHVLSHSGTVMRACHDVGVVWEPRIDRVKLAFAL